MGHLRHLQMVLLLLCITWIEAEKIMRPKMKDINLWSDNAFVSHSVAYNDADPHFNFSMTALQELHDIDIHFEGHLVQKQDPSYFLSFNTTMDFCRLIRWRNLSPIGTILHAYMREYGNLIESCPIAKGKYYINKFWIPEDTATATLPEADFDLNFMAYHLDESRKRTLIVNDHFTGEMVVQDVDKINGGFLAMLPKGG